MEALGETIGTGEDGESYSQNLPLGNGRWVEKTTASIKDMKCRVSSQQSFQSRLVNYSIVRFFGLVKRTSVVVLRASRHL